MPNQALGFTSVLSLICIGLIGLKIGAAASWCAPDGKHTTAQVQAVLFEPEASGLTYAPKCKRAGRRLLLGGQSARRRFSPW